MKHAMEVDNQRAKAGQCLLIDIYLNIVILKIEDVTTLLKKWTRTQCKSVLPRKSTTTTSWTSLLLLTVAIHTLCRWASFSLMICVVYNSVKYNSSVLLNIVSVLRTLSSVSIRPID